MKPFYFPIESGIYEVTPGLRPLGRDFGNGAIDANVFQFDEDFEKARAEKLEARLENLAKYFGTSKLSPQVQREAVETIVRRLISEWPQHFVWQGRSLVCLLTKEKLTFDAEFNLSVVDNGPTPAYENSLDALLSQVQEDGAILSVDPQGNNWLSLLHVLLPSHWDPRDKLGHDFATFHKLIPGFERLASAQTNIAQAMVHKGPFVRFVWSFVTDTRMNHHPKEPKGANEQEWRGRTFDASKQEPFYLRIERQITLGLPNVNASLFFIRLSFIDGSKIKTDTHMRTKLTSALKSMSPEARAYKGVDKCFNDLITWLEK